MEIKEIEALLTITLKDNSDEDVKKKYIEAVSDYLKNHKSNDEILSVVVRGIDIDRASNYFDYLEGVYKNDIQSIWKQVRENKEILKNTNNNGIKFLSGLLSLAFLNVGCLEQLSGNVIAKLTNMSMDDKHPITQDDYIGIFKDYFIEEVSDLQRFPEWGNLKISGVNTKKFAEDILKAVPDNSNDDHPVIIKWASYGLKIAEDRLEQEKIEAKIPDSKISVLSDIIEHYKNVEKQFRDVVYENAKLEKLIEALKDDISKLNMDKKSLEEKIRVLNFDIEDRNKRIVELEKALDERKKINDAADSLKKNDEEALLKNIAKDLKAEYLDYVESKNEEMDTVLGEIYREKLNNIFKLLENKGIRME